MSVARVYLPTDRKYKSVKTSSILKFDPEAFDSDDEEQKKKLYQLKEGKGKGVSCQVLRIRATLKQLTESLSAKRPHVPKLNASQIKAGWQSDSDGDSMTMAKKTRKVEKNIKKQASKATSQDIVETYLQVKKEKFGNKQVEKVQSVQKAEGSGISSHILTEYKDGNGSCGSQAENDECSSSEESMEQLQKKFRKMRKDYIEMTHKVEQQKDVLKTLTTKYEQLKTSKSYPLTEKTGRQILALLENNRWEGVSNSTCDEKFNSKDPQTEPKIGTLKGE
ncbi:uncharacterized protein [Temnothorax nylanderi]|uniref:uncharacterized protein n=1 Tax=Temnothorax nylanderi TaxID=102681 RepID=UPI003A89B0CE